MKRLAIASLVSATLVLGGCAGENANEKLADEITRAVAANNVAPVESKFVPEVRVKMTHAAVGRLADKLGALGKFERTYEKTPDTAPAGEHIFEAKFEKATWRERLAFNNKGEVIHWDITPPREAEVK